MKKLLLLGLALRANAADLGRPAPPVTPIPAYIPFSWTGFYIGGNVGVAWSPKGEFSDNLVSSTAPHKAPYSPAGVKSVPTIRSTTGSSSASKQISTG
jgi:hypothetical protein